MLCVSSALWPRVEIIGFYFDDINLQDSKSGSVPSFNKDDRLSEQQKYGIYFDDDYDYLQHLKEPGATVLEPVGDSLQSATDGKVHVHVCVEFV